MGYILLVEDNQATADMVVRLLSAEGFAVKHTIYGLDAVKLARGERPDLILMDFNLPDMDGRMLTLVIKKQLGRAESPPIVAFTARTGTREMYLAKGFGCDAFIGKPFEPEELLTVVRSLTTRSTV